MKRYLVILSLIFSLVCTQSFANDTCLDVLNPQAQQQIIKTAKKISSRYQTDEMEQLLMDTAHQRKSPDIFDSKDAVALGRALELFGRSELLRRAISYPYDAESARRQGRSYPSDKDFSLLSKDLVPTPPSESELSALDELELFYGTHGVIESHTYFWEQIGQHFIIPFKPTAVLERMESTQENNGTLDLLKQSAGIFSPGGNLNTVKVHWIFNSLVRAKLVRDLVEKKITNNTLNWSRFSSTDIDRAVVLASAHPELISFLDLFPKMHWMLSDWEIDSSDGSVSTASKKIKGLSDHIAEFYIEKDLNIVETVDKASESNISENVVRFPTQDSVSYSKALSEAAEARITVSPITTDDNKIPTMSDDEELQSMWSVKAAWRKFCRENAIDFEAALITTTADQLGNYTETVHISEDTETISISINPNHPRPITMRQLALFYIDLTEGPATSYKGEAL